MKSIIVMYLFLMAGSAAIGQSEMSHQPYTITTSTKTPTVELGAPIRITIALTNTSDKDIDTSSYIYDLTGLDMYFRYKVSDSAGAPVAKRTHKHPELAGGRPIMGRILKPGETLTEEQDISRLFDVKKFGKHVIQVSRNIAKGERDDGIKSNELTVIVVSPSQPPRADPN